MMGGSAGHTIAGSEGVGLDGGCVGGGGDPLTRRPACKNKKIA